MELFTDSEYLREGITSWIHTWKARSWKKKIKNKDLWLKLDEVATKQTIRWRWVRGHTGVADNERCDVLATEEAQRIEQNHTPEQRAAALDKFLKSRAQIPDQFELPQGDTTLI